MATNSEKTGKAKSSEKPTKAGSKSAGKEKNKPKPKGDGEGPSKF